MVYSEKRMFYLRVKKLHHDAKLPSVAHQGDLGCDLYSLEEVAIRSNIQVAVSTGIAIIFPEGWGGIIKDRSSMANAGIYTSAGVIDSGYRGEIKILLRNGSDKEFHIKAGDKIAQMIPIRAAKWAIEETKELDNTSRNEGGFGSTGKR
jgi:dUTP pyrophosphatase